MITEQGGVPIEVQRPTRIVVDAILDAFPTRAVTIEVPVLQLDTGAVIGSAMKQTSTSLVS